MVLNDSLERGRITGAIPRALRIDDGDWSAFADPQAVRLAAKDASLFRKVELLQSALEVLPRLEPACLLAAFGFRLIAAQENVPPRHRDAHTVGDDTQRIECWL